METDEPIQEQEELLHENFDNAPLPEAGYPPSPALEHLKYYGENESLRMEGKRIVGDIPGDMKAKYFAFTNKNVVNANLSETELRSLMRKSMRLKMFLRTFTPEDELTTDEISDTEQIMLDYEHRLTQSRDGFGTRQRTTMTQVHLQGLMEPQATTPKEKVRFM